uniref:uncharacterized protein LOC105352220 isoform X2 n=1 Tax=Fragaria vesca subsp. vesca TaxID=101020 RepID=UPI0005C97775|nr:PREDICTED: uncharacterized protein LOC105352220 isoform X2 [Fragaria vesca subsp. vesca]
MLVVGFVCDRRFWVASGLFCVPKCWFYLDNDHIDSVLILIAQSALRLTYVDFEDMTNVCVDCDALFWLPELKHVPRDTRPIYTSCCQKGWIRLPSVKPTPNFLEYLLDPNYGVESVDFRKNIRGYHTMFTFTSMGANVDTTVNNDHGPYIFKISGQIYHLMGSLVPPQQK